MGTGSIIFMTVFVLVASLAVGAASSAPWLPTRKKERDLIIGALPMKPGTVVYDLGCGDGAMLFALADAFPGIRANGYEIALPPLIAGWIRKALGGAKYRDVHMYFRDFFAKDFSDADVVFVFSTPRMLERVRALLVRSVRDDARVIIEAWPFPGVPYEQKLGGADGVLPVYVYSGKAVRGK